MLGVHTVLGNVSKTPGQKPRAASIRWHSLGGLDGLLDSPGGQDGGHEGCEGDDVDHEQGCDVEEG